jgi:hypothetical protein
MAERSGAMRWHSATHSTGGEGMVRALSGGASRDATGPARRVARALIVVGLLAGCGQSSGGEGSAAEPRGEAPPVPAPEATPPAAEAPAGPEVQTEAYTLVARPEGEGYAEGELGQFQIALASRPGWHVNQDYPIQVELSGPEGVRFEKTTLSRPDAAEFDEDRARFDVAFTPQAKGEQPVRAKVSFAMCTDENCIMHDETLAFVLPVR